MISAIRKRIVLLLALAAVAVLMLSSASIPQARADGGFVDITGKPVQFHSGRQDPINHQITDEPVPLDKLPAQARDILTTPVSVALDQGWSGDIPKVACDLLPANFHTGPPSAPCGSVSKQACDYIVGQINGKGSGDFHAHDASCAVAKGGKTTASQQDGKVIISYSLPNNVLETYVTTPVTCAPGHGTFLCPTDPKVSLTLDVELRATIAAPGPACDVHVDPFTVQVHNVTIDSQDLTADLAKDAVSLWATITGTDYRAFAQDYVGKAVDQASNNAVLQQQSITGKIAAFTSGLCKTVIPALPSANDIWQLNASVDPAQGIVFQLLDEPPTPSFTRPELTPSLLTVTAGNTLKLDGQFFPSNGGLVTLTWGEASSAGALGTATISGQGTFSTTVTIPADVAPGSVKIRAEAANAKADATIQVVARGGMGKLTVSWMGAEFTSIDTDNPFTLSGVNFTPGAVSISLDSPTGLQLGTATVGADGTFKKNFQVNASQIGNRGGQHKLVAVQNGAVQGEGTYTFVLPEVIH